MQPAPQIGVYYFPNYHVDPRNEQVHGAGWTEWELVKCARPRFSGHRQPRIPLWGYQDEAAPEVMSIKIDAAADHGVDFWIFDWYWYDDGPYLDRCLEQGYLNAPNNDRVKFCCMWANHDWIDIHPAKLRDPRKLLYPGAVSRETFDKLTAHVIERYFRHPSHFAIDSCPYFSVYELGKLVAGFGGVGETRAALDGFREATRSAGFPDLHLNAVVWGQPILPGETTPADPWALIKELGFDSFTSYVYIHHAALPDFPETPFEYVRDKYLEYWDQAEASCDLPYFPNVSVGWDASPRTVQSDVYECVGYPFMGMIGDNTPEAFGEAMRMTVDRLAARQPAHPIITVNAWNEWTEGSYLEPDTVYGMKYLEAIRDAVSRTPGTPGSTG
jgi:hypothetical protein